MFFPLLLVPPKPLTISCSFFSPAKRNSKQTNKNVKQNMQKLISWHRPEEVESWQNPSRIRENGHWVPHLMKRLFAFEICYLHLRSAGKGKNLFSSMECCLVSYASGQMLYSRALGQQKKDSIIFDFFFYCEICLYYVLFWYFYVTFFCLQLEIF